MGAIASFLCRHTRPLVQQYPDAERGARIVHCSQSHSYHRAIPRHRLLVPSQLPDDRRFRHRVVRLRGLALERFRLGSAWRLSRSQRRRRSEYSCHHPQSSYLGGGTEQLGGRRPVPSQLAGDKEAQARSACRLRPGARRGGFLRVCSFARVDARFLRPGPRRNTGTPVRARLDGLRNPADAFPAVEGNNPSLAVPRLVRSCVDAARNRLYRHYAANHNRRHAGMGQPRGSVLWRRLYARCRVCRLSRHKTRLRGSCAV